MNKKFTQPLSLKPSQTAVADAKRQAALQASREQLAQSALTVKSPGAHGPTLAPSTDSPVVWVHVDEVETYEKNPRHESNEADADIRHSISTNGVEGTILVTRIPGRSRYVCAKGANTRLRIIKELWQETRNPKFEKILVQIVMWKGHAAAITDHIIENTVRGDMSFWDKAKACLSIRDELTAERGTVPSTHELEALIQQMGLNIDRPTISRYLHTAEHFKPIRGHCTQISVKALIPATNALLRLALKWELSEAQAWEEMHEALERFAEGMEDGQRFDAQACIEALELAMAVRLQLTQYQLSFALSAMERDGNASKEDLLTSPEPPNTSFLDRPQGEQDGGSQADTYGYEGGDGHDDSADHTPPKEPNANKEFQHRTSAEATARQLAQEDQQRGTGAHTPQHDAQPPKMPTAPAKALSVEEALDAVINASSEFSEACFIGDWVVTGVSYPQGYYMEIRDCEMDHLPLLRDPVAGCEDARIRVGGWWLAASLSRQWDEEETLLLPKSSFWRILWGGEDKYQMSTEQGNLYSMVQEVMGGIIGDDGSPAIHIEYIYAVMRDPARSVAWGKLTAAVQALDAARMGSRSKGGV